MTVRQDVERIKAWGRDFDGRQDALLARMGAIVAAQRALTAGEVGARPALRQSLVELAASAELVAAELPAPASNRVRRSGWNIGDTTP